MIKNRRIIISLGIIAVLLLFLLLSNDKKKPGNIPELKGLDSIDEILITKENNTIRLYNKDDKWLINDEYPADKAKVDKLITGMKELEITDYISNNHHVRYDLNQEKAINVVVKKEGKILRDLLIGKASSTYRSSYIKFADDDNIYLASGNLTNEYNNSIEDLRDKQIYKVGSSEVTWIQLKYAGKTLTFEKKVEEVKEDINHSKEMQDKDNQKEEKKKSVEKWICQEHGNVNISKSKIDSFVSAFSSIKADSFPEMDIKDLKGLLCLIKGKVYDKEIELKIHKKEDNDKYLCSSSESPYVFALREWDAKKFFKKLDDFKETDKKE